MAELLLIGSGLVMAGGMIGGAYKMAKKKRSTKRKQQQQHVQQASLLQAHLINERGFIRLKTDEHRQEAWERAKDMHGIYFVDYDLLQSGRDAAAPLPPIDEQSDEQQADPETSNALWKEINLDDDEGDDGGGGGGDDSNLRESASTVDSEEEALLHHFPRWSLTDDDIRTAIFKPSNTLCLYFAREATDPGSQPLYAGMIIGSTSRSFNDETGLCMKIDIIIAKRGDPSLVLFPLNGFDFHDVRSAIKQYFTMIEFTIDVQNDPRVVEFFEYNGFKRHGVTDDGKVNMTRVMEVE